MKENSSEFQGRPRVVATVHSPASLREALKLERGSVDFVELRVDHFASDSRPLLRAAGRIACPLLVTVRHPAEGGAARLSLGEREALYSQFLPFASVVDIELRSIKALASMAGRVRSIGASLLLSSHHFKSTPSPAKLAEIASQAADAGADVFKLAAMARRPGDIGSLLGLLAPGRRVPVSVMAMGPLGRVSRLLFAQCGSVLNYGYLHRPNASGQWEARVLGERLAELEQV